MNKQNISAVLAMSLCGILAACGDGRSTPGSGAQDAGLADASDAGTETSADASADAGPPADAEASTLIFATAFEPGEAMGSPADAHDSIRFQNTVPGGASPVVLGIFYENPGTVADRYARIIEDPTEAGNHVLHFWLQNAVIDAGFRGHTKGRIQSDVAWGPDSPVTSLCSKQRIYLHPDIGVLTSYVGDSWWQSITINELWLGAPWQGHPNAARISVGVAPAVGYGTLHFFVGAQAMPSFESLWERVSGYVVPVGEWLTVEFRYRSGNATTGRFVMIVEAESDPAPTTIVDVTDFTYDPAADEVGGTGPVPLTNWNPQKVYSSDNMLHWIRDQGGAAQVYFDDFEISSCVF